MSPLDDELRAALHGRAQVLPPSPDPLAGIERRARRIQRGRIGAAVAGSVLAVGMVAAVVPVIQTSTSPQRDIPRVGQSQAPQASSDALDPRAPWPYRGEDLAALGTGTLDTLEREYATRHRADSATLTPLFGRTYEPSQQFELVFLAEVDGAYRWGISSSPGEAGPEFLWDEELVEGRTSLAAALPGDEGTARLRVIASPEATLVEYGPDDASEYTPMFEEAPGVAVAALDGDPATDSYRVTIGGKAYPATAPDLPAQQSDAEVPDNVLDWPARGVPDEGLQTRAAAGYARGKGVAPEDVEYRVLFTGDNDPGQRYVVLQAWVRGQRAQVFGWIETPGRDPEPQIRPLTDPGTPVVAVLLTGIPGRTTDELVVVPQPGTGQVLYTPQGGEERAVEAVPGGDGVVLVDRELDAQGDRLRLLDGDGDLDNPTFDGPVSNLLCGESGCS